MAVQNVRVELKERSYDIQIGGGLLTQAGGILKERFAFQHYFIVTDSHVAKLHLKTLEDSLKQAGLFYHAIVVPAGEGTKSFASVEKLLNEILDHQPERKVALVALGGGVVGDLTGFVASILLRGVGFVQIPTTLLSQVDSSVGGKTGINTRHGKNLVGSFYQPKLVLIDTDLLATLPMREFLSGYAEVVKYGVIAKPEFFQWLCDNEASLLAKDQTILRYAIEQSCRCKAEIVGQDEQESSLRALLNFGHTFGHAYEAFTGYSDVLTHGEGVSIGMVHAMKLSAKLGYCSYDDVERFEAHLQRMGLKTSLRQMAATWDINAIMQAMTQDKKVDQGKLVFILAKRLGEAFIAKGVDVDEARRVIEADL